MTTSLGQTVLSPWLTPVRLASTSNISGTYNNGPNNNGVGATLTIAASSLTIDSVACAVNDRVLLQTQTNTNEQGIYIVKSIGSTVVLQRAADLQSQGQLKTGLYVSVSAGSVNGGTIFTVIEPLPAALGINALTLNPASAAGDVAFTGGPSVANNVPVFADTAGNIKPQSTTATFGFGVTVSTGNIAVSAGNVVAGSSSNAGTLASFPSGATSGELLLAAVTNSSGNFNTTISNASAVGQSQVVSIPDSGATTANFIISKSGGTQHITSGSLEVDAGNVIAGISGTAGFLQSFPASANGSLKIAAVANTGNTITTISNAAMGQASVISIPDPGVATAQFLLNNNRASASNSTITVAAGAANHCTVTIQLKDTNGNNISTVQQFALYSSDSASGIGITATAASTGYSMTSGGGVAALTGSITKNLFCVSSATGGAVVDLLDTAKTAYRIVLVLFDGIVVSAAATYG